MNWPNHDQKFQFHNPPKFGVRTIICILLVVTFAMYNCNLKKNKSDVRMKFIRQMNFELLCGDKSNSSFLDLSLVDSRVDLNLEEEILSGVISVDW